MITEQEKQYILVNYSQKTGPQIAEALGRPTKWLYNATRDLGLAKTSQQKSASRKAGAKTRRAASDNSFVPVLPEPLWPVPSLALAAKTRFRAIAEVREK
jgi:hypothetical protein